MSREKHSTTGRGNNSTGEWDEDTPLLNFSSDPSALLIGYNGGNGNPEYMILHLLHQEFIMSDIEEEDDDDPPVEQSGSVLDSSAGFVVDSHNSTVDSVLGSGQQAPILALPNYHSFPISGGLFIEDDGGLRMAEILSANEEPKAKPASKESIENLENVKIGADQESYCSVCLAAIPVGSEANRMPCLHVYHKNCIVEWLTNSNTCPVCRHQMPTA